VDVEQIGHRTQSAVNGLAQVDASTGGSDRRSLFTSQIVSRSARTVRTMEPLPNPLASPPSGVQTGRRSPEAATHGRTVSGLAPIAITVHYQGQT
jgi:hypothetical protein